MEILELEKLKETVPLFSLIQCDFLSENCIIALEKNNKASGCTLIVDGDFQMNFNVFWSKKVNAAGYKEIKKIIEHAAEVISFFLSSKLTEYAVVEEALIGTGIDYWLGYDEKHEHYDPKNFIRARLEISGINTETEKNTVNVRANTKKKQSQKSDKSNLPVYISVVEFSTPKAYFARK